MNPQPAPPPADARAPSDALVVFGITGDLANKQIFPALYAMCKRGTLRVPVIGVASSGWDVARLRTHAAESIRQHGAADVDESALGQFLGLLHYVDGDYKNPATFDAHTFGYQQLALLVGDVRRHRPIGLEHPVQVGKSS